MRVYLVRHAIAYPQTPDSAMLDSARELTPQGITKMQRSAAALARMGVQCDEIWTSPYTRARQTAEILCSALNTPREPRQMTELEPDGDLRGIVTTLQLHADRSGIALVGHEPSLGRLIGLLLFGEPVAVAEFKKGGVCCIEVEQFAQPLRSTLIWMLTPKQLRWMGK